MESIPSQKLIIIDGSILEGGGQILRISSDLSFLLQKSVKVLRIRAGRSEPGLQNQHLKSLEFLVNLFKGTLIGGKLNSTEIKIIPSKISDVPSLSECKLNGAGSIGLMIQILMPCLIYAPKPITIDFTGGTYCSFSPSIYWLNDILFLILKQHMNINVKCELIKNGLFPRGGGKVKFTTQPIDGFISPINVVSRGDLEKIRLTYYSNNTFSFTIEDIEKEVMKPIKTLLRYHLINSINNKNEKEIKENDDGDNEDDNNDISDNNEVNLNQLIEINKIDFGKGSYTFSFKMDILFSNTIMSCVYIYSSKKEVNDIINAISSGILEKVENLLSNPYSCFDENATDQLIIYMCLAKGKSSIAVGNLSLHTQTAIEIIKQFISSIDIKVIPQKNNSYNIIEIEGIGFKIE